jgi:hypothetical protein
MVWVAFGFSLAYGAQDPNDNGVADTLYLESWPGDERLEGQGPWEVMIDVYVTNDIPDPAIDSIAGFVIPLCFFSTNEPSANCHVCPTRNNCGASDLHPFPEPILENSIFRHKPSMADPQIRNWMMDLSAAFMGWEWDTRILDYSGDPTPNNYWVSLVPTGTQDQRFSGGSRILIFTATFCIEDSTNICLDTCFWPPTGRLAFSRSDAVTYMPIIWDDYIPAEYYCDRFWIPENMPPVCDPEPQDVSHSQNGQYTSTQWTNYDPDGQVVAVQWYVDCPPPGNQVAIVAVNHSGVPAQTVTGTIDYQVLDHCAPGCCELCIVCIDNMGAADTCCMHVDLTNNPPVCTEPDDWSGKYCQTFVSTDFTCTDPDGDATTMSIVGVQPAPCANSPVIVGNHVEWTGDCCDASIPYVVTLQCTDECGASADPQTFTVHFTNDPPVVTCPPGGVVTAGGTYVGAYTCTDDCPPCYCDCEVDPPLGPAGDCYLVDGTVYVETDPGDEGDYTVTICCHDECSRLSACCTFDIEVVSYGFSNVFIPNSDCVNPGEYVCLPILLDNNTTPFGGFELAVDFDYTAMTFVGLEFGEATEGFEKLTYRLLPCPLCGCCKYKILLFGMYDIPNGVANIGDPIPMTPQGVYQVIANLCFVVNNDENLRGMKIPVCFEWEGTIDPETGCLVEDWNCGENTFSSWSGDTLYGSVLCCQFVHELCDFANPRVDQKLIFQWGVCGQNCGGVDVCAAGPGACKRGDVNMNTITYEVADAVLFASYFVEGTSVFRYDMAYQICATDVNADGRTLTLSDLVYLIRVILHDAVELPKLTPSTDIANVVVYNGTISTECASPIGAILFEFDSAVDPTLLADMEMVHNGNKVLVWSSTGMSFSNAEVLSADAELVSVTAVDRDSRELETTITAKVAPSSFALHRAYPNPFNPFTNLSFTLPEAMNYSLRIYNVAGQLVRSYDGVGSQNLNVVTWDGRDEAGSEVSSGVYFYKLTAGGFSATEKMVMMK